MTIILSGEVSVERRRLWQFWYDTWCEANSKELPPLPPLKIFKPKFPSLPVLESYEGGAPPSFWQEFPVNLVQPAKAAVDYKKLRAMALEAGFKDLATLEAVCKDLKFGADIGCKGDFRLPSSATNAKSALLAGRQVSDALADWVTKGFVYGPVQREEVPEGAKFSGLMVRPKPNGAVRVICNLSAPKDQSVNDGISTDDFPTTMDPLSKWLRALKTAGRGCKMVKVDWSDAYKHLAVSLADTDLQWFEWLDMCFKELCLIFGGKSSAGIFDRLAKIVLHIVIYRAGINKKAVIQFLDDCCAAAPANSTILERFDKVFADTASQLGVRLAPRDDPDKSFGPRTHGTVLGIYYDTVAWTWAMPEDKLSRFLHLLQELMTTAEQVRQEKVMSMAGKVLNIAPFIPSGRFNLDKILKASAVSQKKNLMVTIGPEVKKQMAFWFQMVRTCSGVASIPDPDMGLPAWAVDVYTDAAGGSCTSQGRGSGAVAEGFWGFVPWSAAINTGRLAEHGRKLDRVMSALELVGPLFALVAGHELFRGKPVKFWVDNAGSVFIWRKGYSMSCPLSTTLVKAIAIVAGAIDAVVDVVKVTRCSTPGADMADALSKSDLTRFWRVADGGGFHLPHRQAAVPAELLRWLEFPREDDRLGERLLSEMKKGGVSIFGHPSL